MNTVIRNPRDAAIIRLDDLIWKGIVKVATDAALPANTRIGNVLMADANGAFPTVDGVTINTNGTVGSNDGTEAGSDKILVKDEATGANHGKYFLSDPGSATKKWRLTRTSDANASAEVTAGFHVFVDQGTANPNTTWVISTDDPITLNTTSITFAKISGLGQVVAGTGMTKTGDTLNLIGLDGITANADDIEIDFNTTNLKITAGQIDTIQNIDITASPTFAGINVDGAAVFNESGANVDFRIEAVGEIAMFFVDASAKRIGSGTLAPATTLHLKTTTTTGLLLESTSTTGNAEYSLYPNTGSADKLFFKVFGATATGTSFGISNNNLGVLARAGNNDLVIGTVGTGFLILGTNDTEALRIDSSGDITIPNNVGIGTAPDSDANFHIADNTTTKFRATTASAGVDDSPFWNMERSRGTLTTPTTLLDGDRIGRFSWDAHNGSGFSTAARLDIRSRGAANFGAYEFESRGSDGMQLRAVLDQNGLDIKQDLTIAGGIVIGHTAQIAFGEITSEAQILGTTETDASLAIGLWSATDALSPIVKFMKSGSAAIAVGNFVTVADNEELGKIQAYGADGTDLDTLVAEIAFNVDDSSIAAGQIGGEIILATATSGGTLTTSITIDNTQQVGIGTTSPLATLHIDEAGSANLLLVRQAQVTKFTVKNNGTVGVGIALPKTDLHIQENTTDIIPTVEIEQLGTGDAALQFSIVGDAYAMGIDNSDADKFKISYAAGAGTAIFGTNDRLIIDPDGTLSFAMGEGTGQAKALGVANVNTTAVGNLGAGEDDLMAYSLPANSLNTNGKSIRITVWGTITTSNSKTIRLKFGSTIIQQIGATTSGGLDWKIEGLVIRTGAATQKAIATQFLDTIAQDSTITLPTETLSGAVIIKVTGEGVANDDVKQEGMLIEYLN